MKKKCPHLFDKKLPLYAQGILYVDGWCPSFKIIYIFFKTLKTLLKIYVKT